LSGGLVTIVGDNFGANDSTITAVFGDSDETVISVTHTEAVLNISVGEGAQKDLTITVAGQSYVVAASSSFKYSSPVISSVSPVSVSTHGGYVTLTGTNFGRVGAGAVTFVPSSSATPDVTCSIVEQSQTYIVMDIGAGQGSGALTLNVSGQVSSASFTYSPPTVTSVYPTEIPT
jgi:hypothetical protein